MCIWILPLPSAFLSIPSAMMNVLNSIPTCSAKEQFLLRMVLYIRCRKSIIEISKLKAGKHLAAAVLPLAALQLLIGSNLSTKSEIIFTVDHDLKAWSPYFISLPPALNHVLTATKLKMLFEDQRFLHEDLERLEQGISDRVAEDPRHVNMPSTLRKRRAG